MNHQRYACDGYGCERTCKVRGLDDWTEDGERDFCPRCSWRRGPEGLVVFAGMPELGGRLTRAGRDAGLPLMVSANRFRLGRKAGEWRTKIPDLRGSRIALDSAGFVAMKLYGRYPWTVAEYIRLAKVVDPVWYASMDLCCEPELDVETIDRQLATTAYLIRCRGEAERAEIQPPMPVLQGWETESYQRHVGALDRVFKGAWPDLVGVGSVCRRQLLGDDGILAVLDALDRELPENVKLHFFGVKSAALTWLSASGRVDSCDSCAWDFRARRSGKGVEHRIATLLEWYAKQEAALAVRHPYQPRLF